MPGYSRKIRLRSDPTAANAGQVVIRALAGHRASPPQPEPRAVCSHRRPLLVLGFSTLPVRIFLRVPSLMGISLEIGSPRF